MIMLESVYSHGSLSQVTRANFVESDLAVAVISVDPHEVFRRNRNNAAVCVYNAIHSIATNYEKTKSIMR